MKSLNQAEDFGGGLEQSPQLRFVDFRDIGAQVVFALVPCGVFDVNEQADARGS